MKRVLAPLVAGVAVLTVGLLHAFANQTDPPEPGGPPSPVAVSSGALVPFGAITGEVMRGPTCGGPMRLGQVCEEPAQATIDVRDQAGQLVAHFQSDPTGHFLIPLPPGVYTVVATKPGPGQPTSRFQEPSVSPRELTVTSGVVVQVRIDFNTGIR